MSAPPPPSAAAAPHPTTSSEYPFPFSASHPISSIAFHPNPSSPSTSRQLLVSSWDSTVRLYQLPEASSADGETKASRIQQIHAFQHEAPVLDTCWINERLAASGGVDRRVRLLDLTTGETTIIGKHTSAISRIRYEPSTNLLISASWDRTLQLWDPLSSPPRHLKTLSLPDKVLAMDVSPPFPSSALLKGGEKKTLVVAMTGRQLKIYDLAELRSKVDQIKEGEEDTQEWEAEQTRESSLKYMIRDLQCSADGIGYATSSVEGRISVEFLDPSSEAQAKKYAFKCHRVVVDGVDTVYPVNAMGYNPLHGTFFSLGGDAFLSYWDPYLKKRIRQLPQFPSPLSTAAFSADGQILVVASGAENLEEKPSPEEMTRAKGIEGEMNAEVGGIGKGGEGRVMLWVREKGGEECRPRAPKA